MKRIQSPVLGLCVLAVALAASCSEADRPPDEALPVAPPAPVPDVSGPVDVASPSADTCAAKRPRRLEAADTTAESSAIAVATWVESDGSKRGVVFVADEDARAVATLDHDSLEQISVTELDGKPKHVRVLSDGRVAVTLGDVGRVELLELGVRATDPLELRCSASVAAEPWSIAERPGEIVVTSGFGGALTMLETRDLTVRRAIPLGREPRAVLIDDDGRRAFVTHAVGGVVSTIDLEDRAKEPETISLRTGRIVGDEQKRPRDATEGYAMVRTTVQQEGGRPRHRLLVPHASADTGAAAAVVSWGYGTTFSTRPVAPIVGVVDPDARTTLTNGVFNANPIGLTANCLLPRSAVASQGVLYVACADLDAVVAYDATLTDPSAATLHRYPAPPTPTSLALDGRALLVWSEVARTVARIGLDPTAPKTNVQTVLWERDGAAASPKLLRGRYLFNTSRDARIARGRACASCHPDGRDDGLVWSSPDGRRQTPMLAGRLAGTAPYGWSGEHETLKDHLHHTFDRLGGIGLSEGEDLDALVLYIQSLPLPAASPPHETASQEATADVAAHGRAVFDASGCNTCHLDGGTDDARHDVGSGRAGGRLAFDTPSLARVGRTAPYFHDGRYTTLEDVLLDPKTRMFDPAKLTADDRAALATYLETL
ncbi:MAG: c-type cytochrome [Polyangiaceae bacterium]